MNVNEHERQDWTVVGSILVLGFLLVLAAGQFALRFTHGWQMNTNMDSHLDPNSAYLTSRPNGLIEPVDPAILTQPGWIDEFLTPGVSIITGTPFPTLGATHIASPAPTIVSSATNTPVIVPSPTNTFIFFPSTPTSTKKPKPTKTNPPSTVTTDIPTLNPSATLSASTATATQTTTAPPTPTFTDTPTTISPTPTSTPTATQTPVIIPTDPTPPEIGTTPDGTVYFLPTGGSLTLGINLIANGDGGYDLVYYERPAPVGGIFLDWVIVEIGDGNNWYTVFYWGDDVADTNSNMNFNILSNPQTPPETDQRAILASELYNSTGVAINVDAIVPPGTYSYIRFTAPAGDSDSQMEIDAIEVLP